MIAAVLCTLHQKKEMDEKSSKKRSLSESDSDLLQPNSKKQKSVNDSFSFSFLFSALLTICFSIVRLEPKDSASQQIELGLFHCLEQALLPYLISDLVSIVRGYFQGSLCILVFALSFIIVTLASLPAEYR
jgi:hypothetical protein